MEVNLTTDGTPALQRYLAIQSIGVFAAQLLILVILLLGWEYAPNSVLDDFLFSRPSKIFDQVVEWTINGVLPTAVFNTALVVASGLFWGTVTGALAGITMARVKVVQWIFEPIVTALFALPKVSLIPLFILWFGLSYLQKTVFTSTAVFFFIFYSMMNGVRDVPSVYENSLKILGASSLQKIWMLYLPASVGWLLNGMRIATPYAFVAAVSAEVIASRDGLGFLVKNSASVLNSAGMFAAIIATTLFAVAATTIVNKLGSLWKWRV